jgi:hypothetical protein
MVLAWLELGRFVRSADTPEWCSCDGDGVTGLVSKSHKAITTLFEVNLFSTKIFETPQSLLGYSLASE